MATRGGNQSWSRAAKKIDSTCFDYLFALTGGNKRDDPPLVPPVPSPTEWERRDSAGEGTGGIWGRRFAHEVP